MERTIATAPSPTSRRKQQNQSKRASTTAPPRNHTRNLDDPSQDYSSERKEGRLIMKSLQKREKLEGKLERVNRRLARATRALEKKGMKATMRLNNTSLTPETTRSSCGNTARSTHSTRSSRPLPSWRSPYLEEWEKTNDTAYTFNTPVLTSLLSNGMEPKFRYVTEKMRTEANCQLGDKDAKELKRLAIISDGRNGNKKTAMTRYAEDKIIFDRMMRPAGMEGRK